MRTFLRFTVAVIAATAASVVASSTPADNADLQALREQVRALEQQLKVLARQIEIREEAATAAAPTTPKITVNDKGVTLASPDGANSIKFRGLVQLDSRLFFNDGGIVNNAFVLRRARLITEGTFAKNYSFQLVPEFGGSSVSILDANFSVAVSKQLQFKFGKFKSPVGLELLQSDSWTFFNERSIVTNLVPNRDLGIQASGDVLNGTLNYTVGVFGGLGDGGSSTNTDFDNEKDVVARVFATPFKNDGGSPLQNLSFGVSASLGREKTAAGRTSAYRTDGQQAFFAYNAAVINDGQNWRVSPQVDFRNGSFGAIGEYVISTINVRPSATGAKAELQNRAWQLGVGYVLTGEDSSYTGVVPRTNFDPAAGTWGAFEVTARYADLQVDDAAFPLFASAASNADEAKSIGVGLNWYLSKTVAFKFDYYHTRFGFNSAASTPSTSPVLRQDENVFISRFQLAF
ncbi:MAG: porin [Verrucomicrobia bacterium]|nr:porin [Verrucomicrobiota bacterium]